MQIKKAETYCKNILQILHSQSYQKLMIIQSYDCLGFNGTGTLRLYYCIKDTDIISHFEKYPCPLKQNVESYMRVSMGFTE